MCAEYESVQSTGVTFFPTLTYNEDSLPFYVDKSFYFNCFDDSQVDKLYENVRVIRGKQFREESKYWYNMSHKKYKLCWEDPDVKFACPLFLTSDIQNFIAKLRVACERGGFNLESKDYIREQRKINKNYKPTFIELPTGLRFRYIAFPQFGSVRTQRSHWHLLLSTNMKISVQVMEKLISKYWTYGKFSWSKKHGAIVNSKVNAIKYVSRYVSRDEIGYSRHDLNKYLNNEDTIQRFKPFRPRHLQSKNYGISLLDQFRTDGNFDLNKVTNHIFVKGDTYAYSLPNYYRRKMFYNVVQDTKFPWLVRNERAGQIKKDGTVVPEFRNERYIAKLTDFGIAYKMSQFQKQINGRSSALQPFFSLSYLDSVFHDKNWNVEKLHKRLMELRGDMSLCDLSIFDIVYRNKDCFNFEFFESLDAPYAFMRDNAYDYYRESLVHERELYSESYFKIYPQSRFDFHNTFNSLSFYRQADNLLAIISDLEEELGKQKTNKYLTNRIKSTLIRKEYNYNIYG